MNKSYQAVLDVYKCLCKNKNMSKNQIAKDLNLNWRTVDQACKLLNELHLI